MINGIAVAVDLRATVQFHVVQRWEQITLVFGR